MKLVLAVSRTGRLADAARAVGQDPTTIARRIGRLEQALKMTLFEKTQAGHVLTPRGRALLRYAERMESAALQLQASLVRPGGGLSGLVRVSLSEGFGSQIVAPRLNDFLAEHPSIAIDLIASSGFLNPSRRETDIAVMLARPEAGPLVARKLTDYRLGLYASRHYAAAMPPVRGVEDLRDHRLIGYVADLIYAPELRYLAELDVRLEATICSSSIVAQAELVAAGAGCGILPCFIGDRLAGVERLVPDCIDIRRSFWLVVHRDARRAPPVGRFVEWLLALAATIQPLMLGRSAALEREE